MPVFFVSTDQIQNDLVTISGPLHHHLRTSLRYQVGNELWVGDERRRRYRIRLTHIDARQLIGEVVEEQAGPAPKAPRLVLGQALLKGERMDWVIQKATELGIAWMVPLVTKQTVVRPRTGRMDAQQERWERIALEAAQQSERWDVPIIEKPSDLREFCQAHTASATPLILQEREAKRGLGSVSLSREPGGTVVLLVGPEGGWREDEMAVAATCGFTPVSLGDRILRAETATLAALAILQMRLGELG
jgi:16S rRNA (uracil1498-N3)-methyltransferase